MSEAASNATTTVVFGASSSFEVLRTACRRVGLSSDGARLLRLGENALYHLPTEGIVVRIARTADYMKDVQNEVNVARWLASLDFPAAQVTDVEQPIVVAGHPVTFWHYIPGPIGGRGSIGAMGTLLRRLHALPRPSTFRLPVEDILGRIAPRIEKVSIPPADKEFLSLRLVELRSMISQLYFPLPASPTHGDAHTDNLIISDGRPVLIDFERFSWGQPEWDLALTATEYQMAGWWSEEEYRAFVDAYGYDVTTWSGFPVLREVHALKMTTWLMQNVQESQEIAAEYAVRMQTLRDGVVQPWRAF